ncbi:MAG TPA: hypothetical protein VGS41_01205, partial [Chthonomonadales bacterium]|nr:hypothetical protein [Chthonomonadales bacterium]
MSLLPINWKRGSRKARRPSADADLKLAVACLKAESYSERGLRRTLNALELGAPAPAMWSRNRGAMRALRSMPPGTISLAIAAGAGYWILSLNRNPAQSGDDFSRPLALPATPVPNGYDLLEGAGLSVVQPHHVDLLARRISKRPAPDLVKWTVSATQPVSAAAESATMTHLLAENKPALSSFHAFLGSGFQPPVSDPDGYRALAAFREVANLVALDARLKALRGDWAGSFEECLDELQTAAVVDCKGIRERSVSYSLEKNVRGTLWQALGRLNRAETEH